MRRALALCAAAALSGCAGLRGASPALDEQPASQALPALAQQLLDAVPAGRDVWERYMSERGVFVSETGDTATRAELLEGLGRPFPPGLSGRIEVRNPQVVEFGDTAFIVFDGHETQAVFDQHIEVRYKVGQTWQRENGRWRLLLNQSLVRAADPPPLPVDARRLKDYVGTYELSGQWRYRVELKDGQLRGGRDKAPPAPLIPVGDNVFADAGSPLGVLRIFVRGKAGKVERMVQRRKFADTVWIRRARE